MIRGYAIIRESAAAAATAASHAVEALREGRVEQEPAFTDRMLGHVEEAMREFHCKGVVWKAKTLTDRGRAAQEKQYGADFAGVLSVEIPGYAVCKGFVAQAKLVEPGGAMRSDERQRMREQCDQMLNLTPDAFVFLYSRSGISVVPAIAVVGSEEVNPHELYSRSIGRFYEEHFSSFIGDRRISAPTIDALAQLREQLNVRSVLYMEARA